MNLEYNWHFVAFAWEGSNGKYRFWLDETKALGSGKFEGMKIGERGKMVIGEQDNAARNRFTGKLSCIQMWPISLTDAQLSELYNNKSSPDGSCKTAGSPFMTWAQVKRATAIGEVTLQSPSGIRPSAR